MAETCKDRIYFLYNDILNWRWFQEQIKVYEKEYKGRFFLISGNVHSPIRNLS